jgi:hypothetical protein
MKKIAIVFSIILPLVTIAQVGIGTNTPSPSAQLEVSSTSKGYLMPRMTATERNAIVNPTNGLQIFNTTTGCINLFNTNAWFEVCGTYNLASQYPVGSVFCAGPTVIVDVTNPTTGKIWMDRNLGATQVATSSTDAAAYGDLYQWGRGSDGHQCRTSATTTTLSSGDQPGNALYIICSSCINFDWRSPQNNNLWQGVNGVNNPCPVGYRIPTYSEMDSERTSWSAQTYAGAYASPLKFTVAGWRSKSGGLLNAGSKSAYYSQTPGTYLGASWYSIDRAGGCSIRCIKN